MKNSITFTNQEPQRADQFLTDSFPEHSRSFFARLVAAEKVTVNGKLAKKPGLSLKAGDIVAFDPREPEIVADSSKGTVSFNVVDEQDDFMVIDKPAGLLVHSTSPNCQEPSLVDGLTSRFSNLAEMPENLRAGLVHRLDKETSGLVLVAKNCSAQAKLSKLFSDRTINKTYLALVKGHPDRSGTIDIPIGRHPTARHKRMTHGVGMKEAKTDYKVLKYFDDYSLLEVKIHTGRTHQIRVHMAGLGHPILGDFLYGQKTKLIKRQALHAHSLEFNFDGTQFSFQSDLPPDMAQLA